MPSDRVRLVLFDMRDNIELAREFTAGMTLEEFKKDRRTFHAVKSCLEIVSEASRRLPDEVKNRHPDIEWQQMAAAGNFYRHDYTRIEESQIWDTVQQDLSPLLAVIEDEIAILNAKPG